MRYDSLDLAGLYEVATAIASDIRPGFPVYISGELGTGKTALSKMIIDSIAGKAMHAQSPSFQIMSSYNTMRGTVWHIDLYMHERINDDFPIRDVIENDICIIEWPEKISSKPKGTYVKIMFTNDQYKRDIVVANGPQFYGRKKGRPFSDARTSSFNERMNVLRFTNVPNAKKIILDIGFGAGEFMLHSLKEDEDCAVIGAEVYKNSVASFMSKLSQSDITRERVRIFNDNVHILMPLLPSESIDTISILFPDPWPKKDQIKRRLINREFLMACRDRIKNGGNIIIATDCVNYAEQIFAATTGVFINKEGATSADPSTWPEWPHEKIPLTKYALKALADGRRLMWTIFTC